MISCARVVVSGLVQGVFFRDFTQRQATALGLIGWVRNLPDGRVEALAQGERTDVEALAETLKQGPSSAHVTQVEISWCPPVGNLTGFNIRY
jgi:acylphosphatase